MSLVAVLTAMSIGLGNPISCKLSADTEEKPIFLSVVLEPVPSLKDRPGLYRVMMEIEGTAIRSNAQPMTDTPEDDMMFRAKAAGETFYTLGLRRDGAAAMNVSQQGASLTLIGWCHSHEPWFSSWIAPEN